MSAIEYRTDFAGEKHYASRNYGQLRHSCEGPGANRANVDWAFTLRQARKPRTLSSSAPDLVLNTANLRNGETREPLTAEHPDGPYFHGRSRTVGKYQNMGNTGHMCSKLLRVSSGNSFTLDWQLNLRGGLHAAEFQETRWRRHHARPQQSFDMMKENCAANHEEYQTSQITPQDRRPDRRSGAIPCETIRADPVSFRRWPGCEGTNVSQWRHLIDDRSRGHKHRGAIRAETTLREPMSAQLRRRPEPGQITDNRSDVALVEMLGKKKWTVAPDAAPPPAGDPKLYHLSRSRILPEGDDANRELRRDRQARTDANIPETHQAKSVKAIKQATE